MIIFLFQADDNSVDVISNLDNDINNDDNVGHAVDGDASAGHEDPASGSPFYQLTLLLSPCQL